MKIESILLLIAAAVFIGLFAWTSGEKNEVAVFKKLRLLPRWFKIIGIIIIVSGFILPFRFGILIEGQNFIGLGYINIGLFLICFSRDKIEDEMTNIIRLKSFYRSTIFGFVYAIVIDTIEFIHGEVFESIAAQQLVMFILFIYLITYNITKSKIRREKQA